MAELLKNELVGMRLVWFIADDQELNEHWLVILKTLSPEVRASSN